jgi:hypothetical protein
LKLDGKRKTIAFPALSGTNYDKETKYPLESVNDLFSVKEILLLSAKRFAE